MTPTARVWILIVAALFALAWIAAFMGLLAAPAHADECQRTLAACEAQLDACRDQQLQDRLERTPCTEPTPTAAPVQHTFQPVAAVHWAAMRPLVKARCGVRVIAATSLPASDSLTPSIEGTAEGVQCARELVGE